MLAASITNTIRERSNERAARLIRRSENNRLPRRKNGDRRHRPVVYGQLSPATGTEIVPERELPYCTCHRPLPHVEIRRPLGTRPAVGDLVRADIGGLPRIGERFAERVF